MIVVVAADVTIDAAAEDTDVVAGATEAEIEAVGKIEDEEPEENEEVLVVEATHEGLEHILEDKK